MWFTVLRCVSDDCAYLPHPPHTCSHLHLVLCTNFLPQSCIASSISYLFFSFLYRTRLEPSIIEAQGKNCWLEPFDVWAAGFSSGHGVNVVMRSCHVKPKPLNALKLVQNIYVSSFEVHKFCLMACATSELFHWRKYCGDLWNIIAKHLCSVRNKSPVP